MKSINKVSLGVILSVFQVVMVGLSYFVAFKIILNRLGEDDLGIWTLVASVSSVANVANLGVSASLVKFVAKYNKNEEWSSINDMLSTGLIVVAGFMGTFLMIIYFLGDLILHLVIKQDKIELAQQLLPFSLFTLWLNTISSVYLSVLDGLFLTYLRNLIYIVTSMFFCILTYFVIDKWGLKGVALAQIGQVILIIFFANIALYKHLPLFSSFRFIVKKTIFNEIFSYSIKFQGISLLNLLIDPVTKFMLAKYGSISEVGYYEMANRLIVQFRQLVVTANQALIPVISQKSESVSEIQQFYLKVYNVVAFISMPLMGLLIIFSPLISYLWIGHYETFFIITMFFLGFAYTININSSPAYYSFIGIGKLNVIIISYIVMSFANVCFCFVGGTFFNGIGIVIGWSIALMLGSSFQIFSFRREYNIAVAKVYNREFMILTGSFLLTMIVVAFLYIYLAERGAILTCTTMVTYILLFILPNRKNSNLIKLYHKILASFYFLKRTN